MSSFTLPPNLELALRKEKDELEFHTDKYSTCLAKMEDSTEVREEARTDGQVSIEKMVIYII